MKAPLEILVFLMYEYIAKCFSSNINGTREEIMPKERFILVVRGTVLEVVIHGGNRGSF